MMPQHLLMYTVFFLSNIDHTHTNIYTTSSQHLMKKKEINYKKGWLVVVGIPTSFSIHTHIIQKMFLFCQRFLNASLCVIEIRGTA